MEGDAEQLDLWKLASPNFNALGSANCTALHMVSCLIINDLHILIEDYDLIKVFINTLNLTYLSALKVVS